MQAKTDLMSSLVVKIGGSTLGAHDTTLEDIVELQRQGTPPVVVHGGGALITQWLELHQIPTKFLRGLRVTDADGLQVVAAVLAGLVNKELVAALQALGGKAIGLSGVDGGLIQGRALDPQLGYVGEVTKINLEPLHAVMSQGYVPVISSIALDANVQPGGGPMLLNCNADTVAGELAAALHAEKLAFLTDVPGILNGSGQVLSELTTSQAQELIQSGTASGGMIPKLEACLRAREAGTISYIVDGREPHTVLSVLAAGMAGTRVW